MVRKILHFGSRFAFSVIAKNGFDEIILYIWSLVYPLLDLGAADMRRCRISNEADFATSLLLFICLFALVSFACSSMAFAEVLSDIGLSSVSNDMKLDSMGNRQEAASIDSTGSYLSSSELAQLHAQDLPDGLYTFASAVNSDFVLDLPGGTDKASAKLQLYRANGTDAQVFAVSHDSDGFIVIQSVGGNALDVAGGSFISGNSLQLWNDNGTIAQRWIAIKNDDDSISFVSAGDVSLVIDVYGGAVSNGSRVQLYASNGTKAQKWMLTPTKTAQQRLDDRALAHANDLPDGQYAVTSALDDGMSFTASNGTLSLGGFSYSNYTVFDVSTDQTGYRTIALSQDPAFVLDVAGGSASNGTRVQLYASNGTKAQKWIIESDGSGYRFVSALSGGLVIDVPGASAKAGSSLQLYSANGTSAQKFLFVSPTKVRADLDSLANQYRDALPDGDYAIVAGTLNSRMVLDVSGGSANDCANVQLYGSNATKAQRWHVSHDGQGYVTLTCLKSGKAVDISGGSTSVGANVQQYRAGGEGNYAQKWIAIPNEDGSVSLYSAVWINRSLDVSGGKIASGSNVQVYASNGTAAQHFFFVSAVPASVDPCEDILPHGGWFAVNPADDSGLSLDVSGGSWSSGANVQIYSSNQTLSQLYSFEFHDGYYAIRNAGSGRVLDVSDGDIVPGTNVAQSAASNGSYSDNQLFSSIDNGDGSFTFINKATGMALSVGGALGSGANVVVNPQGSANQRFVVTEQKDLLTEGLFDIRSASGNYSLDVQGASAASGANVQLYASNGSFAQVWLVQKVAGSVNTYTFESVCSGNLLTVSGSNVIVAASNGSASQQWTVGIGSSGVYVESVAHPGMVLDINGGNIASGSNAQVYKANGTAAQRFRIKGTSVSVSNGTYFIRSAIAYKSVLDVSGGSKSDGANVQIWSNNDSGAQKWNINSVGNGLYTICNAASGKYLDVKDAQAVSGANVQQWSGNGNAAQRWKIVYAPGGFKLVSALNDSFVLDVSGGSTANGSNISIWQSNNTRAQRFTFQATTYVPPLPADQQAMLNRAQWYNSNTEWLILTDTVSCRTGIFRGSRGNWNLWAFWECAPGKNSTPTVTGEFTVYGKGLSFGHGYTCWYYTQFYGDYLFHTQPCYTGTFNVMDPTMGHRASAGCIRLTTDHAKWIYDNIPYGTKVVNY